jgi:hypothetical protein
MNLMMMDSIDLPYAGRRKTLKGLNFDNPV